MLTVRQSICSVNEYTRLPPTGNEWLPRHILNHIQSITCRHPSVAMTSCCCCPSCCLHRMGTGTMQHTSQELNTQETGCVGGVGGGGGGGANGGHTCSMIMTALRKPGPRTMVRGTKLVRHILPSKCRFGSSYTCIRQPHAHQPATRCLHNTSLYQKPIPIISNSWTNSQCSVGRDRYM